MSSLLKTIVATLLGMGRLAAPYAMIAGKGPEPLGFRTVTLKEIDLPASEAVMERLVPENEAVTLDGFGGKTPSS